MIQVYKYLKGADNYGHLSKEERQRTNNERQIQMGIQADSFNNKDNLTEDQTVPAKAVQISGKHNLAEYKVLCFIYG